MFDMFMICWLSYVCVCFVSGLWLSYVCVCFVFGLWLGYVCVGYVSGSWENQFQLFGLIFVMNAWF